MVGKPSVTCTRSVNSVTCCGIGIREPDDVQKLVADPQTSKLAQNLKFLSSSTEITPTPFKSGYWSLPSDVMHTQFSQSPAHFVAVLGCEDYIRQNMMFCPQHDRTQD